MELETSVSDLWLERCLLVALSWPGPWGLGGTSKE